MELTSVVFLVGEEDQDAFDLAKGNGRSDRRNAAGKIFFHQGKIKL
jgi:hypothetical protein